MNQEPIQPPSFIAHQMLVDEQVVFHCKAHIGLWGIPLILLIPGAFFLLSFIPTQSNAIISVGAITLLMFLLFLIGFAVYAQTDIVLTNKRLIVRQFSFVNSANLEDVRIVESEDIITKMAEANQYQIKSKFYYYVLGFFLDLVSVSIMDKNAREFPTIHFIWLYDFKQFKKAYNAECEKLANNDF